MIKFAKVPISEVSFLRSLTSKTSFIDCLTRVLQAYTEVLKLLKPVLLWLPTELITFSFYMNCKVRCRMFCNLIGRGKK